MKLDSIKVFRDKIITCKDCNLPFNFSAGEQSFYFSKGLQEPKRCQPCREKRKTAIIEVRHD